MRFRALFLLLIIVAGVAKAETRQSTTINRVTPIETEMLSGGVASSVAMEAWGLTSPEYTRYTALMRGPRGSFSVRGISPLEVLGIHAETPAQRREYADRLVRVMYDDTSRILAFEREMQSAWQRSGLAMFDAKRLPAQAVKKEAIVGPLWGKRLAVFVKTENCPICVTSVRELATMTTPEKPLSGLDIYVVDTDDAEAIRAYARTVGITPAAVQRKRITLNPGRDLYRQFKGIDRKLPQVFVRDGGKLHVLDDFAGRQVAEGLLQ